MRRYRRALQVGLLIVIAAFVASLFIFGSSGFDGGATDRVATVDGEPIPVERYQRRYREYLAMYGQVLGDRFTPEMAERFGLPQQVLEDLVVETLAVRRARAEGLTVTDEELNAHIHAFPAFQESGRFTLRRYDEVLRRLGYTKPVFEEDMRRRLTRLKLEHIVRSGVKVSETEVEQAYVQQREEVRVQWALVELAPLMAGLEPSEAELTAYLKEHEAEFRQPERRRVQYVAFDPRDFPVTVSDAEVEKYYAERGAEFETPRQVRASHILVRVPETGGSEAEDRARAAVADAIRRAKAGEDFARIAREVSQDPGTKDRGGDLGLVSQGETVAAFEQALFALGKNEISPEPVRTPFGYHAIKVHEVREGGKKPLKEVAPQIRERLRQEAADRAARAKAEEVRARLLGAEDFAAEARRLGLKPQEATIARRPPVPGAAADPIEETAFALADQGVSQPVRTPAGWVVLKNVQSLPAAVPPLAEVRDKVAAAVKRRRAEALALDKARAVAAEARQADFETAARKAGARTGRSAGFSRARPDESLPGDVMTAALATPTGAVAEPVKAQAGYYVVKVLERRPPDMGALAAERERIERELRARKQTDAWQAWVRAARAGAKVETSAGWTGPRG
ncbi:MAG TPA: peptidyl-prolyl cis-trans isomerase [Candidatus Binatia bacterium]|nr:peptidyl-prolyl cis-trans isomerase [Candidatus Binatia bacterium]